MSPKKIGDADLARNIVMIYAEKNEMPTSNCMKLGIEGEMRCKLVSRFMSDGVGMIHERALLMKADFSESFISSLFGPDGARPLMVRMKLGSIKEMKADGAALALSNYLDDEDPIVREAAAKALVNTVHKNSKVVDALIATLENDNNADVRFESARALGQIHIKAKATIVKESVEALTRALIDDPDSGVRAESARSLGLIGPRAYTATKALEMSLRADASPYVREQSAYSLGYIGTGASNAIPSLISCMNEEYDPAVRLAAALSLAKITPVGDIAMTEFVTDFLIASLDDEDADVRYAIVEALANLGTQSKATFKRLVTALDHPEATIRIEIVSSFGSMGEKAKDALSKLNKMSKEDVDEAVRKNAEAAFKKIVLDVAA